MRDVKSFPNQPVAHDEHGVLRFVPNNIVRCLLDNGGLDLNKLAMMGEVFTSEEWAQFSQLIGYSVSGWGTLSYVSDSKYGSMETMAEDPKEAYREGYAAGIERVKELIRWDEMGEI